MSTVPGYTLTMHDGIFLYCPTCDTRRAVYAQEDGPVRIRVCCGTCQRVLETGTKGNTAAERQLKAQKKQVEDKQQHERLVRENEQLKQKGDSPQ